MNKSNWLIAALALSLPGSTLAAQSWWMLDEGKQSCLPATEVARRYGERAFVSPNELARALQEQREFEEMAYDRDSAHNYFDGTYVITRGGVIYSYFKTFQDCDGLRRAIVRSGVFRGPGAPLSR